MTTETKLFKYPSLLNEAKMASTPFGEGLTFMVTEKMHGANFQMRISKDGEVTAYRRNGQLKPGEKFYDWERIVADHTEKLHKLADGNEIALFGEIIGGHYPGHPSRKPDQKPVQKQIYYCTEYEFVAFDAYDFTAQRFWAFDDLLFRCKFYGIRVVEPWYRRMNIADIVSMDHNQEQSRVPVMFGLDPIKNNVIEGWVIRPEQPDKWPGHVMFKWRSKQYLERIDKKAMSDAKKAGIARAVCDSQVENPLLDRIETMIVPHRLASIKSKLLQDSDTVDTETAKPRQSGSKFAEYLDLMRRDIVEEIRREDDNPEFDIPSDINKKVSKLIVDMLRMEIDTKSPGHA